MRVENGVSADGAINGSAAALLADGHSPVVIPGDDFIRGGKGQDQLTGGANSDTFARLSPDELIFHGAKSLRLASETGDELLDFNSIADTLEFEAKPFGFPNSCTPQDGVNFYTLAPRALTVPIPTTRPRIPISCF